MRKGVAIFLAATVALLVIISIQSTKTGGIKKPLICHVGGTMTPVLEELARTYKEETGQSVEINAAGSGELLAYIHGQKKGDLYVCHDPFIDILMQKWELGVDGWQIAELTPVIVVRKGNPKNIKSIKDLTREDVNLILADYKLSSLGRMMSTIFTKAGIDFDELNKKKKILTNKSGGYATMKNYYLTPMRVTVATLKCSKQAKAAEEFAQFLISDRAAEVLKTYGFTHGNRRQLYKKGKALTDEGMPIALDKKKGRNIKFLAAAGMRKPMDEIIEAFRRETGIAVDPDYGGSGIILSRATMSKDADLFMPGDAWYIEKLQEKTGKVILKAPISRFTPVLLTQKGNPHNITGLKDILRKDLKVGLGEANSCQIGRLTSMMLEKNKINRSEIEAKESTTVNELGVWVKMKNVDVAIVWDAIAYNLREHTDSIVIPDDQIIDSEVTIALLSGSKNKSQSEQFMGFVTGVKGQAIMKKYGFQSIVKD